MEETPRNYQAELDDVRGSIEKINTRILLLSMQRERYEQIGHRIVAAMMGVEDGNR